MRRDEDLENLATVFPTLTRRQLAECLGAVTGALRPLSQLAGDHDTGFFAAVARAVIEVAPSKALGVSFPGLRELSDAVVLEGTFTPRPHLALRQLGGGGAYTWGDLAMRSPKQLRALHHMGDRSLSEVVGVSARTSVLLLARTLARGSASVSDAVAAGAAAGQGPAAGQRPAAGQGPGDEQGPAAEQGPGVEQGAAAGREAGDHVRASTTGKAANVRMANEAPPGTWTDRMKEFDAALGDERDRVVFWASIAVDPPPHADLARTLSISPERVRQLRNRAQEAARAYLLRPRSAPLRHLADSLGDRLGLGFPGGAPWARAAIDRATRGVEADWRPRLGLLLVWLAGPYRGNEIGWVVRGPLPERGQVLAEVADEARRVDRKKLEASLIDAGLVLEAVGDWVAHVAGLRSVADKFYLWEGSVGDKAFTLLGAWERPATVAELVDAIGEGHGERSTRGHLLSDPRFVRIDRTRIGLRGWPQDEYTGTVEELARELEERGGACAVAVLVTCVAHRFDVSVESVRAHTRAPRFVVEGTRIRLRRPDEPFRPRLGLADAPQSYLLGDHTCSYRLTVDSPALRGSSRAIPDGLGAWLGVLPRTERDFFDGTDVLRVSWRENSITGPLIASVRKVVGRLGGARGDQLLLQFDRERSSFTASLVRPEELAVKTPEEQLLALAGVSVHGSVVEAVARAVGATPATVAGHLRNRRENDLLAIVFGPTGVPPADSSPGC